MRWYETADDHGCCSTGDLRSDLRRAGDGVPLGVVMRRKPNERMMTEAALWFLTALMILMAIAGYLMAGGQTNGPEPTQAAQATNPATPAKVYRVSAYCPCEKCCGKFADGITASGHKIQPGDRFCAAPRSVPFGTVYAIPNYGKAEVLDRGGAIVAAGSTRRSGNTAFVTTHDRIDVFFPTHKQALQWGVQYLEVTQLTGENP